MKLPGAWLGGFLFAVHPVCVESVAWVSELKNTLSLPLFLLAASEYVRFDDLAGESAGPAAAQVLRRANRHYAWAVACFLLAMLAKTSMVAFPVVILLHAWWKRNAVTVRDLVCAGPFFLISLVLGLITVAFQHGLGIGNEQMLVGGFSSRLATAGMAILWYLRLLVWPNELLPTYPRWEVDPPRAWQFLPWALIAAGAWWCWRNKSTWGRHLILAAGFFLLMVSPVLGFVTISYMRITWTADHFLYLPMIGFVGVVAAGLAWGYERTPGSQRTWIACGTATLIGILAVLSFRYATLWASEEALWTYTLARNETSAQAHNRLGLRKAARGQFEDRSPTVRIEDLGAFHHFMRAAVIRPNLGEGHVNLGNCCSELFQLATSRRDTALAEKYLALAVDEYAEAYRLSRGMPTFRRTVCRNLVKTLVQGGRFDEAAQKSREFLAEDPDDADICNTFGVALSNSGHIDEAISQYRRALEIAPGFVEARKNLEAAVRATRPGGRASSGQAP